MDYDKSTTSGDKQRLYEQTYPPQETHGTWECVGCGAVYHEDIHVCPNDRLPLRKTGDTAVGGMAAITKDSNEGIVNPPSPTDMRREPQNMPLLHADKSSADQPRGLLQN